MRGSEKRMKAEPLANPRRINRAFRWSWMLLLFAGFLWTVPQRSGAAGPPRVLRTVREVGILKNAEAGKAYPVEWWEW